MKKIVGTLVGSACFLSAPLLAGEFKFGADFRADLYQSSTKVGSADAVKQGYFKMSRARLKIDGMATEKTGVFAYLKMTKTSFDGVFNEYYVHHKVTDTVTVKMGRFWHMLGSWEEEHSGFNTFHYSQSVELGYIPDTTRDGINATIAMGDHTFIIGMFNGMYDPATNGIPNMQASYGLNWYGNFAGGMVQPIVSYTADARVPGRSQVDTKKEDDVATTTIIGVGTRISVANFDIDLDNTTTSTPKYNVYADSDTNSDGTVDTVTKTEMKEKSSSMTMLAVGYNMGKMRPFLKYTMDTIKDEGTYGKKDVTASDMSLGLQYWPEEGGLEYHFAYHDGTLTNDNLASDKDTKTTQMWVGMGVKM